LNFLKTESGLTEKHPAVMLSFFKGLKNFNDETGELRLFSFKLLCCLSGCFVAQSTAETNCHPERFITIRETSAV